MSFQARNLNLPMKTLFTLFFTLLFVGVSIAQDDIAKLPGQPEEREIADFDHIKVMGNFQVLLKKSDKNKIVIENKDGVNADVTFVTEIDKNGILNVSIDGDMGGKGTDSMKVTIYYKNIIGVDARRGAWLKFEDKIEGDSLTFEVASGGHILAEIESRSVYAATSKAGEIKLWGKSTNAHYNVFAGGEIYAFKLDSEDIWGKIRTGGYLNVTGKNILDVTIFSGGTCNYKGEPKAPNLVKKIAGNFRKIRS